MTSQSGESDNTKLDHIVANARSSGEQRATGYRERALKIYPWICGRWRGNSTEATSCSLPCTTGITTTTTIPRTAAIGSCYAFIAMTTNIRANSRLREGRAHPACRERRAPPTSHSPISNHS